MPTHDQLAEILASADVTKKIDLLKKAVMTVTRQKKQLEEEHLRLIAEVARAQEELINVQEEKKALQQRVAALEQQQQPAEDHPSKQSAATLLSPSCANSSALSTNTTSSTAAGAWGGGSSNTAAAPAPTPYFVGQNVLKGLTSIVTGVDPAPGASSAAAAHPTLGADGIEKLIAENESLHRQLYGLRTKAESSRTTANLKQELNERRAAVAALENELKDLRGLLESATTACDRLNGVSTQQKAIIHIYEHFFQFTLTTSFCSFCHAGSGAPPPFWTIAYKNKKYKNSSGEQRSEQDDGSEACIPVALTLVPRLPSPSGSSCREGRGDGTEEEESSPHMLLEHIFQSFRTRLPRVLGATSIWLTALRKLLLARAGAMASVAVSAQSGGGGTGSSSSSVPSGASPGVGRRSRAGQLASVVEGLENLHALHSSRKRQLMDLVERASNSMFVGRRETRGPGGTENGIVDGLNRPTRSAEEEEGEDVTALVLAVLESTADWLELMRLHLPLLQEAIDVMSDDTKQSGVHGASRSSTGDHTNQEKVIRDAGAGSKREGTPLCRASCSAGDLTHAGAQVLALLEGALRNMRKIVMRLQAEWHSSSLFSPSGPQQQEQDDQSSALLARMVSRSGENLLVLLVLLWQSTHSLDSRAFSVPVRRLAAALNALSANCDSSHLRNAYYLLSSEALNLLWEGEEEGSGQGELTSSVDEPNEGVGSSGLPPPSAHCAFTPRYQPCSLRTPLFSSPSSSAEEVISELVSRLEAVDAAAVQERHQLRGAQMEITYMREALSARIRDAQQLEARLRQQEKDAAANREVLEEQIQRLSEMVVLSQTE